MKSTGNRVEVFISVKTAPPPPPSFSLNPRFFPALYTLYNLSLVYIVELAAVRVKFEHENHSPYMVLMTISVVAMIVALLVGIFIISLKYFQSLRKVIRFSIMHGTCFFSGCVATVSMLLVYGLPRNLVWVGYLVVCLILAIAVVCYFFLPELKDVSGLEAKININYSVTILPFPMVLMLHVPNSFRSFKIGVMCATFVIVAAYNCSSCLKSCHEKANVVKAYQLMPEPTTRSSLE